MALPPMHSTRVHEAWMRQALEQARLALSTGDVPIGAIVLDEKVVGAPDAKTLTAALRAEVEAGRFRRDLYYRIGAVSIRVPPLRERGDDSLLLLEHFNGLIAERVGRERLDFAVEVVDRLRAGIGSLNREGRERLLAAFDTVNANFSTLFTHLFGGGEARLVLVESDDPLEAGLEILAQPPGKKLSTLSLLSGGEQTLTALALIFAVFLANPVASAKATVVARGSWTRARRTRASTSSTTAAGLVAR